MYLGFVQEFIDKKNDKRYKKYKEKNKSEIITEYLQTLWYVNQSAYDFQLKQLKKILDEAEEYVTDKMINDLENLSDKDIIIKYGLKPEKINVKYLGKKPDDIKSSAKTDVLRQRKNFYRQYEEKYGKLDEGNKR